MSGSRLFRSIAVVLSLFQLAGCTRVDDFAGTIEALPDGRTRVTNPEQGMWHSGNSWRLVPDLAIGTVEGAEAEVFAQIAAVEVDDGGRIYVLDRQANELRIFSPDGSHLRTVGRAGSGPGEYSNANGLLWTAPDSLLVIDQRGRRYSLLTGDGDFVRSVPRSLQFYGWIPAVAHLHDRIYEFSSVRSGDIAVPVILGTSLRSPQSAVAAESDVLAEKASDAVIPHVDTVRLPAPIIPSGEPFVARNPRGSMMMSVPFTPGPVYHVDVAGNLWHGHGSQFRIYRSTLAGDTTLELTVAATPARVASEELQEWEAGEGVKQFREMGGQLDLGRIPKMKPYLDGIYVDPEGYVWVSIPSAANETVFAVLDPSGRYLGKLQAPGIKRDGFVRPAVRGGMLYFAGRDELDVPRVFRFRIENGP